MHRSGTTHLHNLLALDERFCTPRNYQVFNPPYLDYGAVRPVITGAPASLPYSDEDPTPQTVNHERLPDGSVERVVLMAPASVTHHSDFGQRHVAMQIVSTSATATSFTPPPNSNFAPRGYYMLFLLSSAGVPSEAAWVQLR